MKKLSIAFVTLLALSCGSETSQAEQPVITTEKCLYKFDESSTKVGWTAFKFTEKTGVTGTFNKVNVLISQAAEDMYTTLTGATFTIPVNEVNSENPDRDQKIQDHFFGSMESTDIISGIVKTINESSALIEITLNGISKEYDGEVSVEGETITLKTTIDMLNFEAQQSVDSLNSVCNDLHKGADGVSKLWTEVDINVVTTLKKDCK